MTVSRLSIAVLLAVVACTAPEPAKPIGTLGPAGPYLGDRLASDVIKARLSGQTLYGCYPGGSPWAERYNTDGTFQDMNQDAMTSGTWAVNEHDEVCFTYTAGPNRGQPPYCFIVSETGEGLHFYVTGNDYYAASTSCPMDRNQSFPSTQEDVKR